MAKLGEIMATRNKIGASWRLKSSSICDCGLTAVFQVPAKAKRIWLSLHDKEGPDRVRVNVMKRHCWTFPSVTVADCEEGETLCAIETDEPLNRLLAERGNLESFEAWAECWYE